jgi:hypothetical protein
VASCKGGQDAGVAIGYFIGHNSEDPVVSAAKAQMAPMPARPLSAPNFRATLQATYMSFDREPGVARQGFPERVASVEKEITVAEASGGQSDQPLDLGEIQLQVVSHLALGEPVPELNCIDSAGKPVTLADFRGKYLLFTLVDALTTKITSAGWPPANPGGCSFALAETRTWRC